MIFTGMQAATPAERKVARALLSGWPGTGLTSASKLAARAGTSTPTVLRLVARLGFAGYPDFQARLRAELSGPPDSPADRAQAAIAGGTDGHGFARLVAERLGVLQALADGLAPGEFERAAAVLAAHPKHVVVYGGYFTRYPAMMFADQLDEVIPGVDYTPDPLGHDIGKYLRLGRRSVAVVVDFRRHEETARQTAELARRNGAQVVVVTDPSLSPAAAHAHTVLPVPIGGTPFDTMAPLTVLLEVLVAAVLRETPDVGLRRMQQREATVHIPRAPHHADDAV